MLLTLHEGTSLQGNDARASGLTMLRLEGHVPLQSMEVAGAGNPRMSKYSRSQLENGKGKAYCIKGCCQ